MSYANMQRAATHVFVGSLEEVGRRLGPGASIDYTEACDVPHFEPPQALYDKIAEAGTLLRNEEYIEAAFKASEAVDILRALLAEFDTETADLFVQRLVMPALLDLLRKGEIWSAANDPLGEPHWFFKIMYIVVLVLMSLDQRLSEWFAQTFMGHRFEAFFGLALRQWSDASGGHGWSESWPFYITDVLAAANAIAVNIVEGKYLADGGTELWNGYGWDAPDEGVGGNALAAAQRTYAVWFETHQNFLPEPDNYDKSAPDFASSALGLALTPLGPDQGGPALTAFLGGDWNEATELAEDWVLSLGSDISVQPGGAGQTFDINIAYTGKDPVIAFGKGKKKDENEGAAGEEDAPGTSIELGAVKLDLRTRVVGGADPDDLSEARAVLRLDKGKFHVKAPGNRFLRRLVPDGIDGKFNAAFGGSTQDGFYWEGGLGTDLYTAIDWRSPGALGLEVRHLRFGIKFKKTQDEPPRCDFEAGLGLTAHLGPVSFGVNDLGAKLSLGQAEDNKGSIGPIDVTWDILEPKSVEFSIRAEAISGGGFISRDAELDRWAGAWSLKIGTFRLDGLVISEAGSLIALAWARNLGIPFPGGTIEGLGAMLGLDRRGDAEMFIDGMRTGALGAVLFPNDPVGEAPQLISTLTRLFPQQDDSVLAGLMIQWHFGGESRLIVAELGVILEWGNGDLRKIYVLGQGDMTLPGVPEEIYRVHLELFGEIDVATGDFFLKAELRDSRLVGGELTGGGLIARDSKAEDPWILSVGGFNPRYSAPVRFGRIARVAAHLADRDNLKLYFEAYVAATSSSLQAGGKLALYAGIKGFSLDGALVFDVLYRHDGEFALDFAFLVAIRKGDRSLFSLDISGSLTGTSTWRMVGKASFKLLFVKISLPFEWQSDGGQSAALAAVDGLEAIRAAFEAPEAWLQEDGTGAIALADRVREGVWATPERGLRVNQRVAPLGEPIARIGAAPLAGGPAQFDLGAVSMAGQPQAVTPVSERFNIGLYRDVDLEEAIRAPFAEDLPAGFAIGAGGLAAGESIGPDLVHEEIVLDASFVPYAPPPQEETEAKDGDAVVRLAVPPDTEAPPAPLPPRPSVPETGSFYTVATVPFAVSAPRFAVVDTTLTAEIGGTDITFATARNRVVDARDRNRRRFIVRRHEVAA